MFYYNDIVNRLGQSIGKSIEFVVNKKTPKYYIVQQRDMGSEYFGGVGCGVVRYRRSPQRIDISTVLICEESNSKIADKTEYVKGYVALCDA